MSELDQLNELSMKILIHAGNARELTFQGIKEMEQCEFAEVRALFAQANNEIVIAHKLQTSTLQQEAEGNQIRYSTLFSHAQDTLMNCQSELLLSERLEGVIEVMHQRLVNVEKYLKEEVEDNDN